MPLLPLFLLRNLTIEHFFFLEKYQKLTVVNIWENQFIGGEEDISKCQSIKHHFISFYPSLHFFEYNTKKFSFDQNLCIKSAHRIISFSGTIAHKNFKKLCSLGSACMKTLSFFQYSFFLLENGKACYLSCNSSSSSSCV